MCPFPLLKTLLLLSLPTLFSLPPSSAQPLEKASLYNSNGQLLLDTSLTITKKQYAKWRKVEENILDELCSKIKYPQIAVANHLQSITILAIDCDGAQVW